MPSSTYKREGNSIRLTSQHALSIRKGYSGYTNFATGETGNPIDFCVHVLGMGFVEAVKTLLSDTMSYETAIDHNTIARPDPNSPLILPEPASDNGRVMAYLVKHRGIPPPLVQHLFSEGLLYQAADHGNAVFVNESHTYAEIRGTIHNVKFHRSVSGSHKDAYWSFSHPAREPPAAAFVCEGAIDAISLCVIRELSIDTEGINIHDSAMYASIGGAANLQRVHAIIADMDGMPVYIATDSDTAGMTVRKTFESTPRVNVTTWIPLCKDWNEVLLARNFHL